jgi:hypothetical protein
VFECPEECKDNSDIKQDKVENLQEENVGEIQPTTEDTVPLIEEKETDVNEKKPDDPEVKAELQTETISEKPEEINGQDLSNEGAAPTNQQPVSEDTVNNDEPAPPTIPEEEKVTPENDAKDPTLINEEIPSKKEKENKKMLKDIKILNISIEEDKKDAKGRKKPLKKKSAKLGKASVTATEVEPKVEEQTTAETINTENNPLQETVDSTTEAPASTDVPDTAEEPIAEEEQPETVNEEAANEKSLEPLPDETITSNEEVVPSIDVCEEMPVPDVTESTENQVESVCPTEGEETLPLSEDGTKDELPEKTESKDSTSKTEFEWNFESPAQSVNTERKEEFNTLAVASARREARERPSYEKAYSPPERRSASLGGPSVYRRSRRETKAASAMSYLQLLSSSTITYQEIYGGARFYRARAIHYMPSYSRYQPSYYQRIY